jgi:hypothetical protein
MACSMANFTVLNIVPCTKYRHLIMPGTECSIHYRMYEKRIDTQTLTLALSIEPHSYHALSGIINLTDGALSMKCPIFYNSHDRRTVSHQTFFRRVVVPLERTAQSCFTQSWALSLRSAVNWTTDLELLASRPAHTKQRRHVTGGAHCGVTKGKSKDNVYPRTVVKAQRWSRGIDLLFL